MALREILAKFGFDIDDSKLSETDKKIDSLAHRVQAFSVLISGAKGIIYKIAGFVHEIVEMGDSIGKTSTQLGISTDELQKWQAAAAFASVPAENLNAGLKALARNAVSATEGTNQQSEAFKELEVNLFDANDRLKTTPQLLREAGLALGSMEDRTRATALAQRIFEESGAALIPMFTGGEEALDKLLVKIDEFGGGMSSELIPLTESAGDKLTEFNLATTSLTSQFALAFLPTMNRVVGIAAKVVAWFSRLVEDTKVLNAVLTTLGLTIAKIAIAKFGTSLLSLGAAAALPILKFALLVLVIDDLFALFDGRESVIGNFIDKIFGEGSSEKFVENVKKVGSAFGDLFSLDFKSFNDKMDEVFGPPGQAIIEGLVQAFYDFEKSVNDWGNSVSADLDQIWDDIVESAKQLPNDIIDGIISGLTGGSSKLTSTFSNILSGMIKSGKDSIEAKSPSKLSGDEIGTPVIQGIVKRMAKEAKSMEYYAQKALLMATGISNAASVNNTAITNKNISSNMINVQAPLSINVQGNSSVGQIKEAGLTLLDRQNRMLIAALVQKGQ